MMSANVNADTESTSTNSTLKDVKKPFIHGYRDYMGDGLNYDAIFWTKPESDLEVVGYEFRYSDDDGRTWTEHTLVGSDALVWRNTTHGNGYWEERDMYFQVRADFGDEGFGPWSHMLFIRWHEIGYVYPFTYDTPSVTGHREILANGKVNDTINWSGKPDDFDVVGYDIRYRSRNTGAYQYIHIDDATIQTWSSLDDEGLELNDVERRFHVSYLIEYGGEVIASDYSYPFFLRSETIDRSITPSVSVVREAIEGGVIDTVSWGKHPDQEYVNQYNVSWTNDGGKTWPDWPFESGYIPDKNKRTWNNLDDAGEVWSNTRRGFRVRYGYYIGNVHSSGPWSEIVYVDPIEEEIGETDVSVSITVSPATTVAHTETVTLTAQVSDPTQVASYLWKRTPGGKYDLSTTASLTLGGAKWPNSPGNRTFRVTVTLNDGSQIAAEETIAFTDPPPPPPAQDVSVSITVSPSTSVLHTETVTLTAQVSDPAQVASYLWKRVPNGKYDLSTTGSLTLQGHKWPDSAGTRTFQVTVSLNDGSQVTAEQPIVFTNP